MAADPSMSGKLTVPSCRSLPWTEQVEHVEPGIIWAAENVKTGSAPRPGGDVIGDRDPVEA
jgi:hypothetical protein